MTPERDKRKIRFVGALSLGVGFVTLVLSAVGTLFTLLGGDLTGQAYRTLVAFVVMLVMSSCLMGCGAQLARLRLYTGIDIQTMRLTWSGLLIVMVIGGGVSIWVVRPMAELALLIILLLLAIRPAVIRLSG